MNKTFETWLDEHEEWRRYSDLVLMPPTLSEILEEYPDAEGSEIAGQDGDYSWTSYGVTRQALYLRLRREGQSHRFAEMVALQKPPRCMTDDVFFSGLPCFHETMTESTKQFVLRQARKHGFDPPPDAIYQSGLARFPGDPEAFVTRAMGRNYIRRLCESRGWACDGAVKVEAVDRRSDDPLADRNCVPLAEDIIQNRMRRMFETNPELRKADRHKLRREIIQKHGPSG